MTAPACPACPHDRLLHDSWGCKLCNCGQSIIYLTVVLVAATRDKEREDELLAEGKALVAEADRVQELQIRELRERALSNN